ncbi:hypothetical protein HPB47_017712, partial [Ixodes persulcatus]
CDTGFGHLLAKRLAKEEFYVFAGCLFSDGKEAKELLSSPNVHALQLDVTKEDQVELALEEVKKNLGGRGCDTGFGHLLAKRLAKEGFYVFAGCLFSDGKEAKELLSSPNVHALQLDVTKEDQVELALEEVKKNLGGR